MKAVNCSPSTFAKTMKRSAKPPLVIHIFSPLSMKLPSACLVARALRAERIRAGARFAERVGADQLAGDEPRQVLLLLRVRAETDQRSDHETRLRAEGRRERGRARRCLADDDRATLSRATPP